MDVATFLFEEGKRRTQLLPNPNTYAFYEEPTGYSESIYTLEEKCKKLASGLLNRLGLQHDQKVLICSRNSLNYTIIMYGTLMAGGVVSFANPEYTPRELAHVISDSDSQYIFAQTAFLGTIKEAIKIAKVDIPNKNIVIIDEKLRSFNGHMTIHELYCDLPFKRFEIASVEEQENKLAFIPYSSGTTGLSKGVMLTHRNIVSNVIQNQVLGAANRWYSDKSVTHRFLAVLPFYHIYATVIILAQGLATGIGVVICEKFDMKLYLECVQKHKITFAHLVPPLLIRLINDPLVDQYDVSSIRFMKSAAAPLYKDLIELIYKKFTTVEIIQLYGVTESSPSVCATPRNNKDFGSSGFLTANQVVKIIDDDNKELDYNQVGEVCIKGPNIMKGYWKNPEATKSALDSEGFLHTGDIGFVNKDGQLSIVDRKKELIKYKGFQVPPAELESLLLAHPSVADCAVIGVYLEEQATEIPKAFITLRSQHAGISESEKQKLAGDIRTWIDSKVVSYKKIRGGVEILDVIPKSAAGKILRRLLRDRENEKLKNKKRSSKL
ncbi:4-coumarate-CoA ligase 1 [Zancudomyces culisetae]|uniref:4-coumarate-CoA ligase 1 n=1 Tax=Zancudomyces culisetae TaxID=1213189 RepID=A0A1R1PLM5_ZANCU|nr:4-coumarate-CoA ligase 1 [Zancudomyces culisetae]OMH81865.1 4-coumarate-CoA ligase 1 [Zancudomyces culisetae]|eukprot:OMH81615.1 4-coumarate-CoA ligase 1 [Zancudomyces culisetae]